MIMENVPLRFLKEFWVVEYVVERLAYVRFFNVMWLIFNDGPESEFYFFTDAQDDAAHKQHALARVKLKVLNRKIPMKHVACHNHSI